MVNSITLHGSGNFAGYTYVSLSGINVWFIIMYLLQVLSTCSPLFVLIDVHSVLVITVYVSFFVARYSRISITETVGLICNGFRTLAPQINRGRSISDIMIELIELL